jgi:hypothetical protein
VILSVILSVTDSVCAGHLPYLVSPQHALDKPEACKRMKICDDQRGCEVKEQGSSKEE